METEQIVSALRDAGVKAEEFLAHVLPNSSPVRWCCAFISQDERGG